MVVVAAARLPVIRCTVVLLAPLWCMMTPQRAPLNGEGCSSSSCEAGTRSGFPQCPHPVLAPGPEPTAASGGRTPWYSAASLVLNQLPGTLQAPWYSTTFVVLRSLVGNPGREIPAAAGLPSRGAQHARARIAAAAAAAARQVRHAAVSPAAGAPPPPDTACRCTPMAPPAALHGVGEVGRRRANSPEEGADGETDPQAWGGRSRQATCGSMAAGWIQCRALCPVVPDSRDLGELWRAAAGWRPWPAGTGDGVSMVAVGGVRVPACVTYAWQAGGRRA
jgi:hypothetical protein